MLSRTGAEDTWGWIDNTTGTTVLHALSHRGNGAASAGAHAYSLDGLHWVQAEQAAAELAQLQSVLDEERQESRYAGVRGAQAVLEVLHGVLDTESASIQMLQTECMRRNGP